MVSVLFRNLDFSLQDTRLASGTFKEAPHMRKAMSTDRRAFVDETTICGHFAGQCQDENTPTMKISFLDVVKRRGIYNEEKELQASHAVDKQYLVLHIMTWTA